MEAHYITKERFVEIFFDGVPSEKIRTILKECKWRWNRYEGCWRNYANYDNVEFAKGICETVNPKTKDDLKSKKRVEFNTADLIIRKSSFYCDKNHKVEEMAGEVNLVNKKGEIQKCLVPVVYCHDCNLYYMLEETFASLKKRGILLHQIISYSKYKAYSKHGSLDTSSWEDMSILKMWGYNVSQEEDLSDEQRRAILELILDKEIMNRDRILSYLDFFVRMHPLPDAQEKWNHDRRYIEQYKLNSAKRVIIGSITVLDYV